MNGQTRARGRDKSILMLLKFLAEGPSTTIETGKNLVALKRDGLLRYSTAEKLSVLSSAGLLECTNGMVTITDAGLFKLKRMEASVEPYLAQHGRIAERERLRDDPVDATHLDESESPLAWLARRKDKNGKPLIGGDQFQAGERLRADFTRAGLTPRVTANWIAPVAQARRGGDSLAAFTDAVIAAKERLNRALESAGPEFSGLLLDVCCFLKGLEVVEHERRWPPRTAKVVLGLALDRLARHYGIQVEATGPARASMRAWQAPGARPTMEGY
jgi:hypothetical protein